MKRRRRSKQALSLKDWLCIFARDAREAAAKLRPGIARDDLLRKARQAEIASRI